MTGLAQNSNRRQDNISIEKGRVLSTAESDSNLSEHTVKVVTAHSGQFEAEVSVSAGGDFYLPPVKSIVTIARLR